LASAQGASEPSPTISLAPSIRAGANGPSRAGVRSGSVPVGAVPGLAAMGARRLLLPRRSIKARAVLLPGAEQLDLTRPLRELERDGFARLGRVLDDGGLAALRARAVALMLGHVVHPGMFFQLDAVTGRYEDAPLGLGWQGPSL